MLAKQHGYRRVGKIKALREQGKGTFDKFQVV